jgi:hypothetical protein
MEQFDTLMFRNNHQKKLVVFQVAQVGTKIIHQVANTPHHPHNFALDN